MPRGALCASGTRSAPTETECRPNTPAAGAEWTAQAFGLTVNNKFHVPSALLRGILLVVFYVYLIFIGSVGARIARKNTEAFFSRWEADVFLNGKQHSNA